MGTRGLTIVVLNGTERIAQYGQWDHYPSGQGRTVLRFCQEALSTPEGRQKFAQAVDRTRELSSEEVEATWVEAGAKPGSEWVNISVGRRHTELYPALSRDTGAKILDLVLDGVTGISTDIEFIKDSLFCEWAYCVNLDTGKLEVYRGFQKEPHQKGRYASNEKNEDDYYPCGLVAEFDLDDLPDDDTFVRTVDPPEEEAVAAVN